MSSSSDLPLDRLATTDSKGNRIYLYLADVKGIWSKRRTLLSFALIALFLGLPWLRIGGQPAILIDILHRRFAILGVTFWAHDVPILFLIVAFLIVAIAFITAIWGRVWCGWGCPQTVFLDQVFRRVERWIEGDALARKKLDESKLSVEKFFKKGLKWGVFLGLTLVLSHSFLAYFVGTEKLAQMMKNSPWDSPGSFGVMMFVASAILFDLGWFREQFCTVLCPYGRFQSVLMDNQSAVVAYDVKRGEPRRGSGESTSGVLGDCVNCYRCVRVCPTGIDIRRGVQLECVACTACMDACDEVMRRTKKPTGLIRYGNQSLADGLQESGVPWWRRARAWTYLVLLLVCGVSLFWAISSRAPIEFNLIRAVDFPYQVIPSSTQTLVLNHFKADIRNQTFGEQAVTFSLSKTLQDQNVSLVVSNHKISLLPGEPERADLFIQFPKTLLVGGRLTIQLGIQSQLLQGVDPKIPGVGARTSWSQEVPLVGPFH